MPPLARQAFRTAAFAALLAASFVTIPPQASAQAPCTCRAAGMSYALDACTCLDTPAGPRRACCGKVLNNSAWKFTAEACPTAQSASPDASVALQAPPVPADLRISATSLQGISHDQP